MAPIRVERVCDITAAETDDQRITVIRIVWEGLRACIFSTDTAYKDNSGMVGCTVVADSAKWDTVIHTA